MCFDYFLKVPVNSEAFSDIPWCSEAFWGILISSEQFCRVAECSYAFFFTFLGFLRVLMHSHRLRAILKGSLRFWSILSHWDFFKFSEAFSLVLSCSQGTWRFWLILWQSGIFGGVLMYLIGYEQFCIVSKGSEVFYDVLGCSEEFRGVFMGSELLRTFLEDSDAFLDILGCFEDYEALWGILMGSKGFWVSLKVLWHFSEVPAYFEAFQSVRKSSELFWKVPENSEGFFDLIGVFCCFLRCSDAISLVPSSFERFLKVCKMPSNILECSEAFLGVLLRSKWLWMFPEGFEAFCDIQRCSYGFDGILKCSHGFWGI